MTVAVSRASKRPARRALSPEKGNELLGLALIGCGLFLVGSLASYSPADPSLFHRLADGSAVHNWIGPVGAEISAVAFGFLGLPCLLVPLFLLFSGWRRLVRRDAPPVVGRGIGMGLLLASLPALLALTLDHIAWRGGTAIPAGGAFGTVLADLLGERLHFVGSLTVVAAAVAIGAALTVQSTLGDALAAWRDRLLRMWEASRLARERRRERRHKERARRRVITKHLQRVVEEKEKQAAPPPPAARPAKAPANHPPAPPQAVPRATAPAGDRGPGEAADAIPGALDLPLHSSGRVVTRKGESPFAVRRVSAGELQEDQEFRRVQERVQAAIEASRRPAGAGTGAEPPPSPALSPMSDLPLERRPAPPRMTVLDDPGDLELSPRAAPSLSRPEPALRPEPARSERGPAAATSPVRPPRALPQKELPFVAEVSPAGLPPVNLLQMADPRASVDQGELVRQGEAIRSRCGEFGVDGTIEAITPGPVITVYEFQPAPGVKVSHIVNLQDDLALALKAESVRIDRMSGRSTLGLEVPNRERSVIRLGNLLADERFQKAPSVLTMALGTNIHGEPYYADLATMPHLLVAGATGAGKSVGLQSMITSILYKATREDVQFIFIDPKRIELGVYADIPHLKCEVVVDPKKAANALRWAVNEMERRYRLLAEVHVRSIAYYNRAIKDPEVRERLALSDEGGSPFTEADLQPLPYYVVVIDELADLMMVSSADVETSIARLAQMARAIGIHLIIATQRPSVDVLTGTIKANFPCRIAFATASRHDSRTILDQVGSEKLLGKGDMLMMPPGSSRVMRLHGAYISEQETASLVRWLKRQGKPQLDPEVLRAQDASEGGGADGGDNDDDLYDEAAKLVVAERQASASFLQRRMRIGFSRAARLIDMMEREGLLGPPQGSKPREVLVRPDYFSEVAETHFDDEEE